MTPAEQGQERWTIHRCSECGNMEGEKPQGGCCPVCGVASEPVPIEVVPAAELEMCQRYFPFMRRSRDEAVRKLGACQEELRKTLRLAGTDKGDLIAAIAVEEEAFERAETARDEAVKREKALVEAIEAHLEQNQTAAGIQDTADLYAALDQSGKEARA